MRRRAVRLPATLLVVLAIDLVLDPGAVSVGFWRYAAGGAYYGVPASNFAGWLLSGAVTVTLLELGFDLDAVRARLDTCEFALDDMVSFVLLWGTIDALYGNWVPVAIAAALVAGLGAVGRLNFELLGEPFPTR